MRCAEVCAAAKAPASFVEGHRGPAGLEWRTKPGHNTRGCLGRPGFQTPDLPATATADTRLQSARRPIAAPQATVDSAPTRGTVPKNPKECAAAAPHSGNVPPP